MKSKQFIKLVNKWAVKDGENSDLWIETEEMLKEMAEHYEKCKWCREMFDNTEPESFSELEKLLGNSNKSDWICSKNRR